MKSAAAKLSFVVLSVAWSASGPMALSSERASIGSKTFTESYILAELLSQRIEEASNLKVERRFGMGGTGILFEAMKKNEIHLYPEYTGTISEAILKKPSLRSVESIRNALKPLGFTISGPLGFNNTYAMVVRRAFAQKHSLKTISDLVKIAPEIRAGFSHEFMSRADGFTSMKKRYSLPFRDNVKALAHSLAYEAIAKGEIDLTDAYSTDAKIEKLDLVALEDDLRYFPEYNAVILAQLTFVESHPEVWDALRALEGQFNEGVMTRMNAAVDLDKKSFAHVASEYFDRSVSSQSELSRVMPRVWRRTKEHLFLVGLALVFSVLAGVPLGILATRRKFLGQTILLASGLVQTIPSLALLCFLIPLFGIGTPPALVALFLYGLLPVVVNTYVGLTSLDPRYVETGRALGLNPLQRLRLIELPLASSSILAGIKTSAIIGIGTATLSALIGSGGYGAPIVTGLAINDMNTILIGAIPAAGMALTMHFLFEIGRHWVIPKGLR